MAEEVLGATIKGRRNQVLISTKATFRNGPDPNDVGSSRFHLLRTIETSLRRSAPIISTLQLYGFDAITPIEEVLGTLDDLVAPVKFVTWAAGTSPAGISRNRSPSPEKYGRSAMSPTSGYSLIGRESKWELMRSPSIKSHRRMESSWGRLLAKSVAVSPRLKPAATTRGAGKPARRLTTNSFSRSSMHSTPWPRKPEKPCRRLPSTGSCSVPLVTTVIIGARNEEQLRQNLAAVGWNLTPEQTAKLDDASARTPIYPYWHQKGFAERNPFPTP
jgi:hypothetical protein